MSKDYSHITLLVDMDDTIEKLTSGVGGMVEQETRNVC